MNHPVISNTADLIKAFRLCKNAGEQIELFEKLATQDDPPTDVFVQILREIKLEIPLVLSIRAFGAISNENIKESLKQSEELLAMLSQQAKSGSSDLIRWTAAVTIDTIGFDFLTISQYLTEEPSKIVEKIVASKRKIINSFNDYSGVITERSDYQEIVNFWVYGPIDELRSITRGREDHKLSILVNSVVELQGVYGIKIINKLLEEATDQLGIRENHVFESAVQSLSMRLLDLNTSKNDFSILTINQGHFLESNDPKIRLKAASSIIKNRYKLSELKSRGIDFYTIAQAILDCDFKIEKEFSYENVVREDLVGKYENLHNAIKLVSRNQVKDYLKAYANKISHDLNILSPGLSWHKMLSIEENRRQVEEENQRLQKEAEKNRIADEKARKKLKANSIKLALISPIIFFDLFCIGVYLTSKESYNNTAPLNTPLNTFIIGAIIGPGAWLALLIMTGLSIFYTLFNNGTASLFALDTQRLLGMYLVMSLGGVVTWGSSKWLPFLKDYLDEMKSKK